MTNTHSCPIVDWVWVSLHHCSLTARIYAKESWNEWPLIWMRTPRWQTFIHLFTSSQGWGFSGYPCLSVQPSRHSSTLGRGWGSAFGQLKKCGHEVNPNGVQLRKKNILSVYVDILNEMGMSDNYSKNTVKSISKLTGTFHPVVTG